VEFKDNPHFLSTWYVIILDMPEDSISDFLVGRSEPGESANPTIKYPRGFEPSSIPKFPDPPPQDVQDVFLKRYGPNHLGDKSQIEKPDEKKLLVVRGNDIIINRIYCKYHRLKKDPIPLVGESVKANFSTTKEGVWLPVSVVWNPETTNLYSGEITQVISFGFPEYGMLNLNAILNIHKHGSLKVDWRDGTISKLLFSPEGYNDEQSLNLKDSFNIDKPTEFPIHGFTYKVVPGEESFTVTREQNGKILDNIVIPKKNYYDDIVNTLFTTKTLENPTEAPAEYDFSWRNSDPFEVLGIKWTRPQELREVKPKEAMERYKALEETVEQQ
jgi:hypothetical protein